MLLGFTTIIWTLNLEGDFGNLSAISPVTSLSPQLRAGCGGCVVVYDKDICLVKNEPMGINTCKVIPTISSLRTDLNYEGHHHKGDNTLACISHSRYGMITGDSEGMLSLTPRALAQHVKLRVTKMSWNERGYKVVATNTLVTFSSIRCWGHRWNLHTYLNISLFGL